MTRYLVLNSLDNVAVVVNGDGVAGQDIHQGESIGVDVRLQEGILRGHKVAIKPIPCGDPIIKFGEVIGTSTKAITVGEHVHVHNIRFAENIRFSAGSSKTGHTTAATGPWTDLPDTFNGYLRKDGRAGVRNYIVVASTVNCSATVTRRIAEHFRDQKMHSHGVDGVVPVIHGGGCAQAIEGYGYQVLNRTIGGWLDHPNVVAALVVGLGCESIDGKRLVQDFTAGLPEKKPIEFLTIQDEGGTGKAIKIGIERISRLLMCLPRLERVELPVSLLALALNCGGSDAHSGLTANRALGVASDILVSQGGSVVLAEIPECHGAEDYLLGRCVDTAEKEKLRRIFEWWGDYAIRHGISMNNNLAPGNLTGGISTILEKSLGAVAKAGGGTIRQILDYAERVTEKGVILMNTPGFDPVSVTGLVAGGCNVVGFTTGRGSTYGCSIAPTVKISSNTEVFERMRDDMDIDAGGIVNGRSIDEVGEAVYRLLIRVAEGQKTCSEINGVGIEEFVPWHVGETL